MQPHPSSAAPFDAEVRVRHPLYKAADESFAVVLVEAPDGDTDVKRRPPRRHDHERARRRQSVLSAKLNRL